MTRLFRSFIVAAFVFGIVGMAGVVSADAQIDLILKRMDDHNKAMKSMKASVLMSKTNAQLGGDADISRGTAIYLPRPGRNALVRIDWTSPSESLAVVDKSYVIYRPRLSQAYTGNVDKAQGTAKTSSALAFMNMSRAQLRDNYSVAYLGEAVLDGGVRAWHLELTPKAQASYKKAEIWVDPDGMPVQTKIFEVNNDTTTVRLSNIQKNITINQSEFKITLPRGTKIIKS